MLPTIDSGRTGDHRRFIFGDSSSSTLTRRLIQSSFAVRPSVVLLSIVPSALSFLPFFDSWFNFERNNFANFCFYCQFSDLIQFTSESQSVIFRRSGSGDESVGGGVEKRVDKPPKMSIDPSRPWKYATVCVLVQTETAN